jgi:prepilin-type N-terminal cleavage/methylation domain-containing protein
MKKSKLFSESGFSVIECLCVLVIICIVAGVMIFAVSQYRKKAAEGTDRLNMVTAQNLAAANVNVTGNIFDGNNLKTSVGYYDDESNSIVDYKPKGYNKSTVMTVNGIMYTGSPGTMVIRITYDGSNIKYDWVEDH